MSKQRDNDDSVEEPDVRDSPHWEQCTPANLQRGDQWFEDLHPLVDRCFKGLGVETGIDVQDKGFEVTIPGEASGPEYQQRRDLLDGLEISSKQLKSLSLRRFAREPKRRGMELARLVLVWEVRDTNKDVRQAMRTVRLSCSPRLDTRELSVDVPEYRVLRDLRWSAYQGFVDIDPDTLQYRIPVEPEVPTEHLALIEHSCVQTLIQCIPVIRELASRCNGLVADESFTPSLRRILREL